MAKKEINIFSVSIIDLLAGALGAIIILFVMMKDNPVGYKDVLEKELACNAQFDDEIAELNSRVEKIKSDISSQNYSDIKLQIKNVEEHVNCYKDIIQKLEDIVKAQQDTINMQRDSIANQKQQIKQLKNKIVELEQKVQELTDENNRINNELAEVKSKLHKIRVLNIMIKWTQEGTDIDLHVIDPNGNEFYYSKKRFDGYQGELTEDDTKGPGFEVWEAFQAGAGTYQVYYKYYSKGDNSSTPNVNVTGRILYKDGARELNDVVLTTVGEKTHIISINIANDGDVSFN